MNRDACTMDTCKAQTRVLHAVAGACVSEGLTELGA